MATTMHGALTGADNMHVPYAWTFADATALAAGVGVDASGIGKLARKLDDNTLWMLTGVSPVTWKAAGGADPASLGISVTPGAGKVPKAGVDGKLDPAWLPGSGGKQLYNAPGSYTFTIPAARLRVRVQGGGGGGDGVYAVTYSHGGNGGTSSFGSYISATGGGHSNDNGSCTGADISPINREGRAADGLNGDQGAYGGNHSFFGSGGVGTGGQSTAGASAGYGAGGGCSHAGAGYLGNGGGAGGYGEATITGLTVGATVTVVVGAGGSGGATTGCNGSAGRPGFVLIEW